MRRWIAAKFVEAEPAHRLSLSLVTSSALRRSSSHAQSLAAAPADANGPALSVSDDAQSERPDREEQDCGEDGPFRSQLGEQHGFQNFFCESREVGMGSPGQAPLQSELGRGARRAGDEGERDNSRSRVA